MSAEQQVITIDDISADNAPTIFVAGGLGRFIDAVKDEVCAEVPDLKTRKGRDFFHVVDSRTDKVMGFRRSHNEACALARRLESERGK